MNLAMGSQNTVFLSGKNNLFRKLHLYTNLYGQMPGLDVIREFSSMEATTARPENPTLLEMYSDGRPLGMGIGLGGPR